jgi:hypothetical protein
VRVRIRGRTLLVFARLQLAYASDGLMIRCLQALGTFWFAEDFEQRRLRLSPAGIESEHFSRSGLYRSNGTLFSLESIGDRDNNVVSGYIR